MPAQVTVAVRAAFAPSRNCHIRRARHDHKDHKYRHRVPPPPTPAVVYSSVLSFALPTTGHHLARLGMPDPSPRARPGGSQEEAAPVGDLEPDGPGSRPDRKPGPTLAMAGRSVGQLVVHTEHDGDGGPADLQLGHHRRPDPVEGDDAVAVLHHQRGPRPDGQLPQGEAQSTVAEARPPRRSPPSAVARPQRDALDDLRLLRPLDGRLRPRFPSPGTQPVAQRPGSGLGDQQLHCVESAPVGLATPLDTTSRHPSMGQRTVRTWQRTLGRRVNGCVR